MQVEINGVQESIWSTFDNLRAEISTWYIMRNNVAVSSLELPTDLKPGMVVNMSGRYVRVLA